MIFVGNLSSKAIVFCLQLVTAAHIMQDYDSTNLAREIMVEFMNNLFSHVFKKDLVNA